MSLVSSPIRRVLALIILLSFVTANSLAQSSDKSKSGSPENHLPDNPDILRQMNRALEELAARVSPAVVQIQTTGYGPLNEGDSDGERRH